ncbi:hypothetical protein KFE25_002403 [Diacronema lutheri]|uniref:Uncharacterized protein n=1 Tax=Diacronema lutheri TaxID=2081491 RepID=A0A8J6C5N0_DIALT|nr:hypothetical protein KFE25_002403 [Diacronema lutheri]
MAWLGRSPWASEALALVASVGFLVAASGGSWAVTQITPIPFLAPVPSGPDATETVRIGLVGIRIGDEVYGYDGELCAAFADCLAVRDAAARAHAVLIASAAAALVACLVHGCARASGWLPAAARALLSIRANAVARLRLGALALTLLVAAGASIACVAHFARVGAAAAEGLEALAADPLAAIGALAGDSAGSAGAPFGAVDPAKIPWKDTPWARIFPPSASNAPSPAAPAPRSLGRRLDAAPAMLSAPRVSSTAGARAPDVRAGVHAYLFGGAALCALAATALVLRELCDALRDDRWPDAETGEGAYRSSLLLRV